MDPIVKFYEEDDDLMPKIRHLVEPDRLLMPFTKLMEKKWRKTVDEFGHVRRANDYLEAFHNSADGRVLLYYISDLLNKLGLSVSYEMFKNETGYDLFEVTMRHQMEEQIQYMYRPEFADGEPQIIFKLSDFVVGQDFYNKNPDCNYDREVIPEIWEDLNLWPSIEPNKRPVRRGRPDYETFLLNATTLNSTPTKKKQSKWERARKCCSMEMDRKSLH